MGITEGKVVGVSVGITDGALLGTIVVGATDGPMEGTIVGDAVGSNVKIPRTKLLY